MRGLSKVQRKGRSRSGFNQGGSGKTLGGGSLKGSGNKGPVEWDHFRLKDHLCGKAWRHPYAWHELEKPEAQLEGLEYMKGAKN